jgi:integrase/recombinase XerD
MAEISPLRRRMIEDMTVRNLSPATQQSYLNAVSKFGRYFGRSPDRLGLEDVHAFQVHLVATGISWPALNQIVCALRFFYGVTLGQDTVPERIAYAREPSKLPVVVEGRRGRALPGGNPEPQKPHRAGHGLCRRTARVGSSFS